MKLKEIFTYLTLFCAATLVLITGTGCRRSVESLQEEVPEGAAMYYWKTVFSLDSVEAAFLSANDVRTLYIRFFDVVEGTQGEPMPNATTTFADRIPQGVGFVPVVFIDNRCLGNSSLQTESGRDDFAEAIVMRISRMCATHDLGMPDEIQLDCDWTEKTRGIFFDILSHAGELAKEKRMRLSATIRLHQLSQEAPPVDYGVLMVYNTGDFRNPDSRNPVLDEADVEPYLGYVADYPLGLCAAYPIFRWPVVYGRSPETGKTEFRGFLYGVRPDSLPELWRKTAPKEWTAIGSRRLVSARGDGDRRFRVVPGIKLRIFSPPPYEVTRRIESKLGESRKGINSRVILYDLDRSNIKIYTENEIKEILHP